MKAVQLSLSWAWRIVVAAVAWVVGTMIGAALAMALALEAPAVPETPDPATGTLLAFYGGLAIALGLAALASGLSGSRMRRWLVLSAFAWVVHGVGTAIETSIFTTLGGGAFSTLLMLPASLICAFAVVRLFPAPGAGDASRTLAGYFGSWSPAKLAVRLLLALLAFPVAYFLFGLMVAPIVTPHYEQLDFLVIPPMPTLLAVLHARSALFLAVSLPVIVLWRRSRTQLGVCLSLGHFTAVGLAGLLQVTFFPAVMRWTHGVEILADSLFYGFALAWLLFVPLAGREEDAAEGSEKRPLDEESASAPRASLRLALPLIGKVLVLGVVLTMLSGLGAALFLGGPEAGAGASGDAAQPPSLPLVAFTVLLAQAAALAYPVIRSRWDGWGLIATVALIHFGTTTFLGIVETLVYPAANLGGLQSGVILMSAFAAVIFAPILVWTLGHGRAPQSGTLTPNPRLVFPAGAWVWRLAVGAAVFVSLYYLFGYYVAWKEPAVREFYGGTDPGSFFAQMSSVLQGQPWMVPFQYLRGLLWVLLALPIIRMMRGSRWETGLALSLVFGVPALYLLFPNPVMPAAVRLTHLVETLPYQFFFGWFLAWLFLPATSGVKREVTGHRGVVPHSTGVRS